MRAARNLLTLAVVTTMALPSLGAAPRIRPVNLYLSTGAEAGTCSPTTLTTRPTGQSSCGPINPTGGTTTWASTGADEGFPFMAAGDQDAVVTIVLSNGSVGVGTYEVTVDVLLTGDEELTASETVTFETANGDMTITFEIPIDKEMEIDGGRVTVTATGLGVQSYFVDGAGGSFIRILPPPA